MSEEYVVNAEIITDDNQLDEVSQKLEKINSLIKEAKTLANELASVEINIKVVTTNGQ